MSRERKFERFEGRAIDWLRTEKNFDTPIRPEDHVETSASEGARIRGYFVLPSNASNWAYAGLCALVLGCVLTMFSPPGVSSGTSVVVQRTGYGTLGVAAACFIKAELTRRRNRSTGLVELRPATSAPATAQSLLTFRESEPSGHLLVVAERAPEADVLIVAAAHRIQYFTESDDGFREVRAPAGTLEEHS